MNKNEFVGILKNNQSLTSEQINSMILTLNRDSVRRCSLASYVYDFFKEVVASTEEVVHHGIHSVVQKYINKIEAKNSEDPALCGLYVVETIYCYYADSISEALHYANKAINLNSEKKDTLLLSAYSYAVSILLRHRLEDKAISYRSDIEKLIKKGIPDENLIPYFYQVLLDIYSHCDNDKYYETLSALETILKDNPDKYGSFRADFLIHRIYHEVLLGNTKLVDKKSIISMLEEASKTVRFDLETPDDYSYVLVPIFQFLGRSLSGKRLVELAMNFNKIDKNIYDRISLLTYLIEKRKIDRNSFPDLYKSCNKSFETYYKYRKITKIFEIQNEISNSENEKTYIHTKRENREDDLTGLGNQRALDEDVEVINRKGVKRNLIVVMTDLNCLKSANDSFGHSAGAELIRGCGEILNSVFSSYGKCYRFGGDEYVIIANMSKDKFKKAISSIKKKESEWKGTFPTRMSISIGYAFAMDNKGMSFTELKELADKNMYADKDLFYKRTGLARRI